MNAISELKKSGFSLNEGLVLAFLACNCKSSQSEIAEATGLALSAVSQIIGKHCASGVIDRPTKDDNNVKRFSLSEFGMQSVSPFVYPDLQKDREAFDLKFSLPTPLVEGTTSSEERPYYVPSRPLDRTQVKHLAKHLQEELKELQDAKKPEDQLDALVDLIYVAMGGITATGADFDEAWRRVQRANMAKVKATSAKQSKRGNPHDVIKPEGWEPPVLTDLFY